MMLPPTSINRVLSDISSNKAMSKKNSVYQNMFGNGALANPATTGIRRGSSL